MAAARAQELKAEGNKHFATGDFVGAEAMYSKAINMHETEPLLYTNRAMARLKLGMNELVIADCDESLRLLDTNMKAHFNKAQAELALGRPVEAEASAAKAYELCVHAPKWQKDLAAVGRLVLRCKKAEWEARVAKSGNGSREECEWVVGSVEEVFDKALAARLAERELGEEETRQVTERSRLEKSAAVARIRTSYGVKDKETVVPDWIIDDISFNVMHDPVVTKTGKSYERASIMEHLRRSETDPLTREPLRPDELRPNLALRTLCNEYLRENGWAVDW